MKTEIEFAKRMRQTKDEEFETVRRYLKKKLLRLIEIIRFS